MKRLFCILFLALCAQAQTKIDLGTQVRGTLPVANGGSGTTSPSIVPGAGIGVAGTWPNQTISFTGSTGSGFPLSTNVPHGDGLGGGTVAAYAPANCNQAGFIFTQFACANLVFNDDGSTAGATPRNLSYFEFAPSGFGPSMFGNAEGRSTNVLGSYGIVAHGGIFNDYASAVAKTGLGDVLFRNWNNNCNGGTAFQSDQGCQLTYQYGGEGANGGHFTSTVISGGVGATNPSLNAGGGCGFPLNQNCQTDVGWWLMNTSRGVTTGRFTGSSVAFAGSGSVTWLKQLPTTGSLPTASAWGYAINTNITTNTTPDAPIAQTFTLQGGAGTFANGDMACVVGGPGMGTSFGFWEQHHITSVSGSSPTQTITMPLSRWQGSIAIFKGNCYAISFDANYALSGNRTSYVGVSIDGSNLIYTVAGFSQDFSTFTLPQAGAEPETTDNTTSAGFHLFCGARITKQTSLDVSVGVQLEDNACDWEAGDSVESPNFDLAKVNGMVNTVVQYTPSTSSAFLAGIINHMQGMGASGPATGIDNSNDYSTNCSAYAVGTCGGNLTPPVGYLSSGHWSTDFLFNYTPATTLIAVQSAHPGQTSYYIYTGPWGQLQNELNDSITGANTWFLTNGSFRVQTELWGGYGGVSGGWGASTYSGPTTAPTGGCTAGQWSFSQDGKASFCKAGTWEVVITAP